MSRLQIFTLGINPVRGAVVHSADPRRIGELYAGADSAVEHAVGNEAVSDLLLQPYAGIPALYVERRYVNAGRVRTLIAPLKSETPQSATDTFFELVMVMPMPTLGTCWAQSCARRRRGARRSPRWLWIRVCAVLRRLVVIR